MSWLKVDHYPLPLARGDLADAPALPPFFDEILGKSVEDISEWLAQSTQSFQSSAAIQVRESILRYRPLALAYHHYSKRWSLKLVRDDDLYPVQHFLLFSPPIDTESLNAVLEQFGMNRTGAVPEFFGYFPELSNARYGGFFSPIYWQSLQHCYCGDGDFRSKLENKWSDAAVVYTDAAGNILVMESSGEMAWVDHELGLPDGFVPFRPSFDQFLSELSINLNRGYFPDLHSRWP